MSGTGWTWQHVQHHCDLPTYLAMCRWWREVPPAAVQLRRIASFLGLKENAQPGAPRMAASAQPSSPQDIASQAAMAGMPAFEGRPSDPMLDLIPPAPQQPENTP